MDEIIKNMIDDKKNYDKEGKFYLNTTNKSDLRVVIYSSDCVENKYLIRIYTEPCCRLTTYMPHFIDSGTLEDVLILGYKLFNQGVYSKITNRMYLSKEKLEEEENHFRNKKKWLNEDIEHCLICLEECDEKLKCKHYLCSPCLRKLSQKSKRCPRCPLCKEKIFKTDCSHDLDDSDDSDDEGEDA
jgi:hypothetical protein